MKIIKKSLVLIFLIVFSGLVIAQENFPPECAAIDCLRGFKCVEGGNCVPEDRLDECVINCKEVICKDEGEECRSKCIRECKGDKELRCLQCGDGCAPSDLVEAAMCARPTKELKCGVENGRCVILEDEYLTEEELEEDIDIGTGGITPDSPIYFIDEMFAKIFGEDREEKIAEIKTMVEKGDYNAARVALRKYEAYVDSFVKDARPENRGAARSEAAHIRNILKKIEASIPEEYREEFVEAIIEGERSVVTAVEISSKIKELCESLSELDPLEYSRTCKTEGDSPKWQQKLDKKLTKEQINEAKKFGKIMKSCFDSSGRDCKCDEIPFPDFANACSRAAPLAIACETDEAACAKLDNLEMPRLPPHLQEVMDNLDVMESKFDMHMPPECAGVSPQECKKIMIKAHAPEECREALLAADVDNERDSREICDKIMMEKHAPDCAEKGITDPDECARLMDKDHEGPRIDFDCKKIEDPMERLDCYDKASSQAKGYKGHDDEDYDGPCMTEEDWKAKKQECRDLYGDNAGDKPIMGDSGQGYECVIDAECVDFKQPDDNCLKDEDWKVKKQECRDLYGDSAGDEPIMGDSGNGYRCAVDIKCIEFKKCGDCASECPGASRTDCINDKCECFYDDRGPGCMDCASECPEKEGQLLSGTGCVNDKCECYYRTESECKDGCQQECGDQATDCVDDKCVCLGYAEGDADDTYDPADYPHDAVSGSDGIPDTGTDTSSDSGSDDTSTDSSDTTTDTGSDTNTDSGTDDTSTDSGSSDTGSDTGSDTDSGSDDTSSDTDDKGNGNLITGNAFLDYWY